MLFELKQQGYGFGCIKYTDALPAWGMFLSAGSADVFVLFMKHEYKCVFFSNELLTVNDITNSAALIIV